LRAGCRILKATNTHSEGIILNALTAAPVAINKHLGAICLSLQIKHGNSRVTASSKQQHYGEPTGFEISTILLTQWFWGGGDFYLLAPNVNYSGRTAPLTSKVTFYIFIQQI